MPLTFISVFKYKNVLHRAFIIEISCTLARGKSIKRAGMG